MGPVSGFLMFFACSVSSFFVTLFGFISKVIYRVLDDHALRENNSNCKEVDSTVEAEEAKILLETDEIHEIEKPSFFFKFQFPSYEEFCSKTNIQKGDYVSFDSLSSPITSKCESLSDNQVEEHENVVETVVIEDSIEENGGLSAEHFMQKETEEHVDYAEESHSENPDASGVEEAEEKSIHDSLSSPITSKCECLSNNQVEEHETVVIEDSIEKNEGLFDEHFMQNESEEHVDYAEELHTENPDASGVEEAEEKAAHEKKTLSCEESETFQFLIDNDFITSDIDSETVESSNGFTSNCIDTSSDGFLSERDFEHEESDSFDDEFVGEDKDIMEEEEEEFKLEELENFEENFVEEDKDIMDELKKLEESCNVENSESPNCEGKVEEGFDDAEKPDSDTEDSNELETLWEHQDLIEQLKMEMKKVRATGLPTILEESETPKMMEDLKPWKIDEKFQHQDTMSELHKFYKSYRERMRKLDILNYQKMYALGFLQSKDSMQSISSEKNPKAGMKSLLSPNFLACKHKKPETDPTTKFISELNSDLEVVYVGQLCLSWEILHWQYEKAVQLWESDQYGSRRYNEVAGEYQQFQVLLQRFIENEPFEAPRVQNYVKNRCLFRNLLQVPVVREDGKSKRREGDSNPIKSHMLVETMEESIRLFWRFVRADKNAHSVVLRPRRASAVEPQDVAELELILEAKRSLQKKEKKLKDVLRSGNCIMRRFQKHEDDSSDQVLHFFSQVDMKLVARVLNMSKLTAEQVLWCHSKLSSISFVSRKMHVEPCFLLFPV